MEALKNRYEPQEEDDYLTLSTEHINSKLENDTDDPEKWFHRLEYLCQRMQNINAVYEKKEMKMKSFILTRLPEC